MQGPKLELRAPIPLQLELRLPSWFDSGFIEEISAHRYPSDEDKMRLAIQIARKNVIENTGGPFGAAIFSEEDAVVSLGVNRVVPGNNPTSHAEMVAIQLATTALKSYTLGSFGKLTLATSAQPCAMCCGAIPWSGVSRILIGATAQDTERLTGFDEGPIHPQWREEYRKRGISVVENVAQADACEVFALYVANSGKIYNGAALDLSDATGPAIARSASQSGPASEAHTT